MAAVTVIPACIQVDTAKVGEQRWERVQRTSNCGTAKPTRISA